MNPDRSQDGLTGDGPRFRVFWLDLTPLGEAATQVGNEYPDWADQHPEAPWRAMRGMRNRLAHGYFEINLDVVWETVQTSLADLEEKLAAVLKENLAGKQ